jgi:hypothetical protein
LTQRIGEWVAFALIFTGGIFLYQKAISFPLGGDIFPKFIIFVLMALAVIMIAERYYKKDTTGEETDKKSEEVNANKFQPYIIYLFVLVYLICISWLGFFTSTILFLPLVMIYFGFRDFKTIIIPTVIILLFIYLLFVRELHVPLPTGILV